MRSRFRPVIVLPLLIGALYLFTADAQFVYDDRIHIQANPLVLAFHSLFDFASWQALVQTSFGWSGRPLLFLTYGLTHAVSGLDPSPFRITNIAIHTLNALLVFAIARRLARSAGRSSAEAHWIAWVSSLIFATHPLATESVAYVAGRSSSLCATFYFIGILAFMQAAKAEVVKARLWASAAIAAFLAALLVKQDGMVLPLVICALVFLAWPPTVSARRRAAAIVIALLVVAGAFMLQRASITTVRQTTLENETLVAAGFNRTLTPVTYLWTAVKEWSFYYLWRLFLPVHLNVDPAPRDVESPWSAALISSVICIITLCAMVVWLRGRDRLLSSSLALILISPLAAYCVFPLADVVSEHRAYITLVGAAVLLAAILARMPYRAWVTVGVLATFAVLTVTRNRVWTDEQLLWEDAARKAPEALRPHLNLGAIYQTRGMPGRAVTEYEFVLARAPNHDAALANLGSLYLDQKQLDRAEALLDRAASRKSGFAAVYLNLGVLRLRQQRYAEARALLEQARKLNPQQFMIGLNLGDIAFNEGRHADAIVEYLGELKINPTSVLTHFHLAKTYEVTGAIPNAIEHYRIVLTAEPGNAEVIQTLRQLSR